MGWGSWGRAGTLGWLQRRRGLAKPLPLLCARFPGFTFGRGRPRTSCSGCSTPDAVLPFLAHNGAAQAWEIGAPQVGPCGEWLKKP